VVPVRPNIATDNRGRLSVFAALLGCVLLTAACASSSGQIEGSGIGTIGPDGRYHLSAEEKKLDCKRLRGRMQIRIIQVRAAKSRQPTSTVSKAMHRTLQPVYGGTQFGARPEEDLRRDRAQLNAYNLRLAEMKCEKFDLDRELAVPYNINN
jgi:hypothetical protein